MFTGIIEAIGRIERLTRCGGTVHLTVAAPFARELARGDSVAVNGVCLTVVAADATGFEADAVPRTVATTTLGRWSLGSAVNLERALKLGERLGGHLVTGHVDGVGTIVGVRKAAEARDVTVRFPPQLRARLTARGSVALDGISLTVADVAGGRITVSLIPETLRATVAGAYRVGTRVNVETDLVAKYVEAGHAGRGGRARSGSGGPDR